MHIPAFTLALIGSLVWAQAPAHPIKVPYQQDPPRPPTYNGPVKVVENDVTLLEEVSLLIPSGQPDDEGQMLYRFTLVPGETVTWKLTFDAGQLSQHLMSDRKVGAPAPSATTRSQLTRMNGWVEAARNKGLEFTNNQQEPLPLILVVKGDIGHPFTIAIKRSRK